MKKNVLLFLVALFLFACPPLQHHTAFSKIEYEALGRGGSEYILLEKGKLKYVQNKRDTVTKNLKNEHYKAIYEQLKSLKLSSLENLKVPSTRYQSDGSFAATLVIFDSSLKKYISPTFDDLNPPTEIKGLINSIKDIVKE